MNPMPRGFKTLLLERADIGSGTTDSKPTRFIKGCIHHGI